MNIVLAILGLGLVIALAVIGFVIQLYNALVRQRNEVRNAWAQIDVQLKRRHDLIPNLVATVKGYMQHERETLEAVIKARQQVVELRGGSVQERAQMENMLSQTLKSLFALTETYPELQANENFLALQEEITSTENKIGFARQYYNDAAMELGNKVELFPSNLVAGMFNFKPEPFFEVDSAAERTAPQVSFG